MYILLNRAAFLFVFLLTALKAKGQEEPRVYALPDGLLLSDFLHYDNGHFYGYKSENISEYFTMGDTVFRICTEEDTLGHCSSKNRWEFHQMHMSRTDYYRLSDLKEIKTSEDTSGLTITLDSISLSRIAVEHMDDSATVTNLRIHITHKDQVIFSDTIQTGLDPEEIRIRHFMYRGRRWYQGYIRYMILTDSRERAAGLHQFTSFP